MATYQRKKINKGLIVLNRGERAAVISLLSLIALFLGLSLFRPVLQLSKTDRMAFHNLDSMLAAQALTLPADAGPASTEPHAANRYGKETSYPSEKRSFPSENTNGKGSSTASTRPFDKGSPAPSKPHDPASGIAASCDTKPSPRILQLNEADSTELIALPQIGEVMASRIHRYRDRLGGFVSLDQLFEVKGMDSVRFETIRPYLLLDPDDIRRLDINNDDFKTLLRHPYLEYDQVKAIVNYREHKGLIRDWKQLSEITGEVNPLLQRYLTDRATPKGVVVASP